MARSPRRRVAGLNLVSLENLFLACAVSARPRYHAGKSNGGGANLSGQAWLDFSGTRGYRDGGREEVMSLDYRIYPEENLIRMRCVGDFTFEELIAHTERVNADARFRKGMNTLGDYSEASFVGQISTMSD
jgi:hypothetical protein